MKPEFQPDYTNLLDFLYNRRPKRLPLYEHHIDPPFISKALGKNTISSPITLSSSSISFDLNKKKSGYLLQIKCLVMKEEKRYQKGHFIGLGIAIGLPLGVPIGLAFGNIAAGLPFGLLFGVILGSIMEKNRNKNPVELTEEQKRQQKIFTWIGVVIGVMLLVSIVSLFLSRLN